MILTKEIEIIVNARVVAYYRSLGYTTSKNKKLIVKVEHLNKGSHSSIEVRCDICGNISKIKYKDYLAKTEFDSKYYCRENKCFTYKVKLSNIIKYGVENTSKLKEKQDKWKKTNLKKFGVENTFQSEIIKEKIRQYYRDNFNGAEWNTQIKEVRDKNGWLSDEDLDVLDKYNRIVRRLSLRNKKTLLENWDGYDYYDKEYIRDNFNLKFTNPNYPSIDHKISIKYGFLNGIDVHEISRLDNLCITKRKINSSKKYKTEEEYLLLLRS